MTPRGDMPEYAIGRIVFGSAASVDAAYRLFREQPIDEERLYASRERSANEINEILLYRLRNNIRFCKRCGKALPPHHRGNLCDDCFRKEKSSSARPVWTSRNRR